jgi:hypothetical protein
MPGSNPLLLHFPAQEEQPVHQRLLQGAATDPSLQHLRQQQGPVLEAPGLLLVGRFCRRCSTIIRSWAEPPAVLFIATAKALPSKTTTATPSVTDICAIRVVVVGLQVPVPARDHRRRYSNKCTSNSHKVHNGTRSCAHP